MLGANLFDVGLATDLDIFLGLENVHAIERSQQALPFDWDGESFIDHIKQEVG